MSEPTSSVDINDPAYQLMALVESLATQLGCVANLLPVRHANVRGTSLELVESALAYLKATRGNARE